LKTGSFLGLGPRGFHRVAYVEWGAEDAPRTIVCVHGLTRNGRDFDRLATALSQHWRVACPDVVGRGRSDWLADAAGYGYPQYMADMTALIAKLGVASVDWVGTSMGGIIGMMLAAQPNSPIRRLVLNDVGPFIPKAALERIAGYVGLDPTFDSVGDLEAHLRKVHEPFGPLSDSDWRHLALQGYRRLDDGRFGLAYDPGIAQAFRTKIEDVEFWPVWDAIACPVLILRGARSDLLPARTAAEMTRRGPKGMLVEIAEAGHAPALMTPEQIGIVRDWLGAE
jgi:pimeloyl-ACP methyl ester carboxylesterase